MIAIFGTTRDETLYFETKLKYKHEETILKKYKVTIGTLLNQEVILVNDIHTDYLTSAIFTYIIQKYSVILVFVVGKARSISKNFKKGSICFARQLYLGDVDMVGVGDTHLGQIPTFPATFSPHTYIADIVRSGFSQVNVPYTMVSLISVNANDVKPDRVAKYTNYTSVFDAHSSIIVDSESGGIMTACQLFDVPCVVIKAIDGSLGEELDEEHLYDVYKAYPLIGKVITYCIGQIGRTDTTFTATN